MKRIMITMIATVIMFVPLSIRAQQTQSRQQCLNDALVELSDCLDTGLGASGAAAVTGLIAGALSGGGVLSVPNSVIGGVLGGVGGLVTTAVLCIDEYNEDVEACPE